MSNEQLLREQFMCSPFIQQYEWAAQILAHFFLVPGWCLKCVIGFYFWNSKGHCVTSSVWHVDLF